VEEVLAYAHGRPTASTTAHFLEDADVAADEAIRLAALEEETVDGIVEVPGAAALVAGLPEDRWAVVTSAGRRLAERRLDAAGVPRPAVLVTADDVARPKPDPEGYLLAARLLGVHVDACVAFEDSEAGVRAAVASGARTVVVGTLSSHDGTLPRVVDLSGPDVPGAVAATRVPS
jgi:sugar-phosphatase